MHLQAFGLTEPPFEPAPSARFVYVGRHQAAILTAVKRQLMGRDRIGVITGEPGVGKSILLRRVIADLDENIPVAEISSTELGERELLQGVLTGFGFDPVDASVDELRNIIRVYLAHTLSRQCDAMLVVEDAQRMSAHALDAICRLAGLEQDGQYLLSILLAGPDELNRIVDSPGMGALTGRRRVHLQVPAFDAAETRGYIAHRVAVSGVAEPDKLFPAEVADAIHEYSQGVPRRIDSLGSAALEAAFAQRASGVTVAAVESAVCTLALDAVTADAPKPGGFRTSHPARAQLVVSVDGEPLGEFPLAEDRIMAGRHEQCEIHLEGRFISRHHAMLVRTCGGYCVVDLNSTNGTFVNSRRVIQRMLTDGDIVQIGSHRLEFRTTGVSRGGPRVNHAATDVLQPGVAEATRATHARVRLAYSKRSR